MMIILLSLRMSIINYHDANVACDLAPNLVHQENLMEWEYKITLGCGEVIHGRITESDGVNLIMETDGEMDACLWVDY